VRHSIDHPHAYVDANLEGFSNVLERCRHNGCRHLLCASSSSVYGANTKVPFSVDDKTGHPVSFYAATKKANEMMAYSYSHLYCLSVTGLRFFTSGPWGRPDMAISLFTKAILEGAPIKLFNHGKMRRDFAYIDDVGRIVQRLVDRSHRRRRARTGADIQCRPSASARTSACDGASGTAVGSRGATGYVANAAR
jgi:UDP-glucuronate 4-epimerase